MRSIASPGHRAQMHKIFQEAKTSLQRDMVFASSPMGSIAARLPISGDATGEASSNEQHTGPQGNPWRYSSAPEFLTGNDLDVREPVPLNDPTPYLPAMLDSELQDAATLGQVKTDVTTHTNDSVDVGMENLPPLPDSDGAGVDDATSDIGSPANNSQESEDELVVSSYGVPLAQPMLSTELEQPMERMEVSQVDAWLYDVLDDDQLHPSRLPRSNSYNMRNAIDRRIYLSSPAKAAAESAKLKRGYPSERSVSDKENIPPTSNYGMLARPEFRPPSPYLAFTSPPLRSQVSSFMTQTPAYQGPPSQLPYASAPGASTLVPPPMRRVTSSGSPIPTLRYSPSPMPTRPDPPENWGTASRFRRMPQRGPARYYPAYSKPHSNPVSRTPSPLQPPPSYRHEPSYTNQSWDDRDRLHSLTGQRSASRSRVYGPPQRPRPEFFSSPPRPANYHQLPPRRKKMKHPAGLPSGRDDLTYYGPGFEIAEDEEAFDATNEADFAAEESTAPISTASGEVMPGQDMGVETKDLAIDESLQGKQGSPAYYDGSEDFDPSPRSLPPIHHAMQPRNGGVSALAFVHDQATSNTMTTPIHTPSAATEEADLRELSPNVTPYRKGHRSKKRDGLRVSPKRRRCPSYYDEDILPRGSGAKNTDKAIEAKRAVLEEMAVEYRVTIEAPKADGEGSGKPAEGADNEMENTRDEGSMGTENTAEDQGKEA